jgi:rubrerythrin
MPEDSVFSNQREFVPNADETDRSRWGTFEKEHQELVYTCSMHPQIIRNEPGNCPICGMIKK